MSKSISDGAFTDQQNRSGFQRLSSKEEVLSTVAAEKKFNLSQRTDSLTYKPLPKAESSLAAGVVTSSLWPENETNDLSKHLAPDKPKAPQRFSRRVFHYATSFDKFLIFMGVFFNICNGTALPAFMLVFGDMITEVGNPTSGKANIDYFVLIQVYLGIGAFIASFLGIGAIEWAAERQIRLIRHHFLEAVMRQEIGWIDTFESGTLASQLNQSCVIIRDGIGSKFGQLFMFMAMFVGGYVVGFIRGWKLALVLSAALPLLAISGYFLMFSLSSATQKASEAYSKAGAVAEEVLGNIRTVVAFGAEQKSLFRYEVHLDESLKSGVKGGIILGLGLGVTFSVMFLSYSLGFWYGGKLIADDKDANCTTNCFNSGNVVSVFFAVIMGAFSIGQAGPPLTAFIKASAAAETLIQLIDRRSLIDPTDPSGKDNVTIKGDITFKNVRFHYPARPDSPIFDSLNVHLPAGKTIALVGGSGCGKSTIIQLIQRFYDPIEGDIYLDGIKINDYNLKWVRDQMALVNQEPRLFARSIADNIRDGQLSASNEDVEIAAKNSNAYQFISEFPNGFDTFVGEGGSQLSGGQKQRIAIARAILRNPAILILDEATSALDNESERIVQQTLDKLITVRKRTTIIIAHRLTTIRNADLIIVLGNPNNSGAIVIEQGTHNELMAKPDSVYKKLVQAQQLSTEIEKLSSFKQASLSEDTTNNLQDYFIPLEKSDTTSIADKTGKQTSLSYSLNANNLGSGDKSLSKLLSNQQKSQNNLQDSLIIINDRELKPPSYFRVIKLLRPYWLTVTGGVIGAAVAGLMFPLFSIIFSEFLAVYTRPLAADIREGSSFWALMFICLAGLTFLSNFVQTCLMEWSGQYLVRGLRSLAFEQMLYQDISFFDLPIHSTGTLSDILSTDVLSVKGWCGDNIGIMIQNTSTLIAGIVIAFTANAKLAAVCIAAFASIVPAGALQMRFMRGNLSELNAAAETGGYVINETISNIRIVTAFNLQQRTIAAYDAILNKEYLTGRRKAFVGGFFYGLAQFLQFGAQALALWYGVELMNNKEITSLSDMLRAIFALMMAAMGIGQTMIFLTDAKKAREAAARVYDVIDSIPLIDARSPDGKIMDLDQLQGKLEFKSISFSYPSRPDISVCKNVSFYANPGETIALVGSSGCGKSTMIQLLERFYDLNISFNVSADKSMTSQALKNTGTVLFDDIDIRHINVKNLRSCLGLVSQEPVLFNTTIKENIRYGKAGASEEEIYEAAKMANAHNFISYFPDTYDTMVGSFGSQLSGGQKQRIALARAMLRNPKVLLLDEATSALDQESEQIVQEALNRLLLQTDVQRTTIIIAHRLSTIKDADKIVVFANPDNTGSSIVEVGKHNELMQMSNGVYKRLVEVAMSAGDKH